MLLKMKVKVEELILHNKLCILLMVQLLLLVSIVWVLELSHPVLWIFSIITANYKSQVNAGHPPTTPPLSYMSSHTAFIVKFNSHLLVACKQNDCFCLLLGVLCVV